MPLIMRRKGRIPAGKRSQAMVQNIDYAPTLLEVAKADTPENTRTMEGTSLVPLFATGEAPQFVDRPLYYAFYEQPGEHNDRRRDHTQRRLFFTRRGGGNVAAKGDAAAMVVFRFALCKNLR